MRKSFWPILAVVALIGFCAPTTSNESIDSTPELSQTAQPQNSISITPSIKPSPTTPTPQVSNDSSAVLVQLSQLAIKGRAPKTGYERELFGSAWLDVDRNGCDTRNDILQRDLTNITYRPGTGDCVVESGDFYDPYTDTQFLFVK